MRLRRHSNPLSFLLQLFERFRLRCRVKYLWPCLVFALCLTARADYYNVTITVTNVGGVITNGSSYTIGSSTRTWTNSVYVPASQILTNGTLAGAAGALKIQAAAYPFSGAQIFATTYGITLRSNAFFSATISAGWGTLVFTTNVTTAAVAVSVPLSTYSQAQQTNVASGIGAMANSSANTNPIIAAVVTASMLTNKVNGLAAFSPTNSGRSSSSK